MLRTPNVTLTEALRPGEPHPLAGHKKYTLYLGCTISTEQWAYEMSAAKVLERLGIEVEHKEGYSCCGITVRSQNAMGFLYMSARNLAIAESSDNPVLTYCTGCRLSLHEANHMLGANETLKGRINDKMKIEGLQYQGKLRVAHVLELLHDVIGPEEISTHIVRTFPGLRVAPHNGCHAIRPLEVGQQDDPENPQKLDRLLRLIGAETPYHSNKTDCCGAPMLLADDQAAFSLTGSKLQKLMQWKFDALVNICPSCQKMFDNQKIASSTVGQKVELPVLYFTQLLGLAMGFGPEELGLDQCESNVKRIIDWKGPQDSMVCSAAASPTAAPGADVSVS